MLAVLPQHSCPCVGVLPRKVARRRNIAPGSGLRRSIAPADPRKPAMLPKSDCETAERTESQHDQCRMQRAQS